MFFLETLRENLFSNAQRCLTWTNKEEIPEAPAPAKRTQSAKKQLTSSKKQPRSMLLSFRVMSLNRFDECFIVRRRRETEGDVGANDSWNQRRETKSRTRARLGDKIHLLLQVTEQSWQLFLFRRVTLILKKCTSNFRPKKRQIYPSQLSVRLILVLLRLPALSSRIGEDSQDFKAIFRKAERESPSKVRFSKKDSIHLELSVAYIVCSHH